MAFNKSKALENALKFLNQGKVAQAIAEYQQILRADPKDQATLMTVGDLYARQADLAHAIEYFERLAQVYLNDGFNSKAIAIYKKIAKLAPSELPPLERLADLYVQQGILSEARPLFLQIAESHLKANRAQKAVEVLHRLLEVEPENLRVQMRLAEIYSLMGQKKEAAQTYLAYAQRLFERGEKDEAEKLVERCLEADPTNPAAVLLKARALHANNKTAQAIPILESHSEAATGGDVTHMLVDYELGAGLTENAALRSRRMLEAGHQHHGLLFKVAEKLVESGQTKAALPLLQELRGPMIEAGEQDKFLKLLTTVSEALPADTEPLEMLADFCRTTSDPFRLNATLGQLSDVYADAGNFPRAEEVLQELADRNKDDERIVERLNALRARSGGPSFPAAEPAPPSESQDEKEVAQAPQASVAPTPVTEEALDEETQRYVAQALTDVDLFSSYGLTQKATHLLENVLQRAPRHTPTLERLLDLHLGAGNEQRTAELAGQLEQIHRERNDQVNADRFAELQRRFQKASGIEESHAVSGTVAPTATSPSPSDVTDAPQANARTSVEAPSPDASTTGEARELSAADIAAEFGIPLADAPAAPAPPADSAPVIEEFAVAPVPVEEPSIPVDSPLPSDAESQPAAAEEELDLSDEWQAISQEVADAEQGATEEAPLAAETPVESAPVEFEVAGATEPASEPEPEPEPEPVFVLDDSESALPLEEPPLELELEIPPAPEIASEPEPMAASIDEIAVQPDAFDIQESAEEVEEPPAIELIEEPAFELSEKPVASNNEEFELELAADPPAAANSQSPATTEDFLNELAAEVDDLELTPAGGGFDSIPEDIKEPLPYTVASTAVPAAGASGNGSSKSTVGKSSSASPSTPPELTEDSMNELAEVFQEFRSELGELGEEDEDLETHYNLGIAYREMGLLDEAIGEFQKVAKAVQKGKPFRYTMNCSTMLGLSFMDKGEPSIAALWYQRALEVPGLDHESILALRYDLGLALDAAGDASAALDCFRQVYAANIEYRDVADRISTLQRR